METWKPSPAHVSSTSPSTKSPILTLSVNRPTYQPGSICHKTYHLQKNCFSNTSLQQQNLNHRNSQPHTGIDHRHLHLQLYLGLLPNFLSHPVQICTIIINILQLDVNNLATSAHKVASTSVLFVTSMNVKL